MNYLQLVVDFQAEHEDKPFTKNEYMLYFAALHRFNRLKKGRKYIHGYNVSLLTEHSGLNYRALHEARQGLMKRGMLYFKTQQGSRKVIYSLEPIPEHITFNSLPDDVEFDIPKPKDDKPAKSSDTPPPPSPAADIPAVPARPKGGVIRRQPPSNSPPPEVYDPDGDHPPDDGVKRNWEGLKGRLRDINCPPDVAKKVVRWSNYGLIGHKVWEILNKIRDDKGLKMPIEYLVSKMNTS